MAEIKKFLTLVYSVVFFGVCQLQTGIASESKKPLRMGYSAWPGWNIWKVTEEKGFFKKNGASVELIWYDNYTDSIADLNSGKLHLGCETLNDAITAIAAGADLKIILTNDFSNGNDQIIAKSDIKTIADLKGKRIAVEGGTVDHYVLMLGLNKHGLTEKDVRLFSNPTDIVAKKFKDSQFDAVGVFAPFTTEAYKRAGSHKLFSSQDFPWAITDHLVIRSRKLAKNRDNVVKIIKSWFETLEWIEKNKEEALGILAKRNNVSKEEYKGYQEGTRVITLSENLAIFSPKKEQNIIRQARLINKFLLENKFISASVKTDDIFDVSLLRQVSEDKSGSKK